MQERIELPIIRDTSHRQFVWHWQWFREQIRILHPTLSFPEQLSKDDGTVRTQEPVTEDDPYYSLTPPEYNYYARDQVVVFQQSTVTITLEHHDTTIGTHFTLDYVDASVPNSKVHLLVSLRYHHIDLDTDGKDSAHWQAAAEVLAKRFSPGGDQEHKRRT